MNWLLAEWSFEWDPRDLWIGVYWDGPYDQLIFDEDEKPWRQIDVYICLLPCLLLYLKFVKWTSV